MAEKKQLKTKTIFSVYGTLKRGQYNNYLLGGAKYIGDFKTEPKYTMYDGGFPIITREGTTSIHCELFETDNPRIIDSIFDLEGCSSKTQNDPSNWYDFDIINTPHGSAVIFVMNPQNNSLRTKIKSGIWQQ